MTTLLLILIDEYGTEALTWDPETVQMELEEDFRVKLKPEVMDKICVGMQIMTSDSFYTSLPDFNTYCTVLSNDECSQDTWEPADAYDITGAMAEVRLLNPPEEPIEQVLDPEIVGYIEVVLKDEHVLIPPESLSFIPAEHLAIQDVGTFAGDEDSMMFQAGYETAMENSEALQNFENETLQKLAAELQELKLEHGNLDFLKKAVREKEEENENQSDAGTSDSGIQSILYGM